ncbi:YciI family protein [Mucilaginibacter sp.]|uniref:YciI family protein n=1 Tax=Mucilaginibacter sp. TaxID=1882438 RepID=UPI002639C9E9|nr:YciI family protein [Mucilaginibacter sp.]MDB5031749.1 hypothetical protein [Mucilaginibacter sp.]
MSAPNFEFVPPAILQKLAAMNRYTLLILTKGENYDHEDTRKIIQSEHLPYTFKLREEGKLLLTMPVNDDTTIRAIGIYASTDKAEVEEMVKQDPAIIKGVFTYELLSTVGLKGDTLI